MPRKQTITKHPTYGNAVRWIADNDDGNEPESSDPDQVKYWVSILLVADLFGSDPYNVAVDVIRTRHDISRFRRRVTPMNSAALNEIHRIGLGLRRRNRRGFKPAGRALVEYAESGAPIDYVWRDYQWFVGWYQSLEGITFQELANCDHTAIAEHVREMAKL